MNLIDMLSDKELETIQNYRRLFQSEVVLCEDNITQVEVFLEDWAKNKTKLFRLLGGQLRKEFDYSYVVDEDSKLNMIREAESQYDDILYSLEQNVAKIHREVSQNIPDFDMLWDKQDVDNHYGSYDRYIHRIMENCIYNTRNIYDNKYPNEIKYLKKNKMGTYKFTSISKDTKIFNVLNKMLDSIKDKINIDEYNTYKDTLEKYRIEVSKVNNMDRKNVKFVLSIHPLDFMTMSDNKPRNWSSCMSWIQSGCYNRGSVEMMTSNNVLCAYIPSCDFDVKEAWANRSGERWESEDLEKITSEPVIIKDKTWRSLYYVEKDILCSGKTYPFFNKNMTLFGLEQIKELAKENLKWTYTFGVEPYKDMKNSWAESFRHVRDHADIKKHYILFETKFMYNDLLNANCYDYFCYRNIPKYPKIINLSGPCRCQRCNTIMNEGSNSDMDEDCYYGDEYGEYNDRWGETSRFICSDCHRIECSLCHNEKTPISENVIINGSHYCNECAKRLLYSKEEDNTIRSWVNTLVGTSDVMLICKPNKQEEVDKRYNDFLLTLPDDSPKSFETQKTRLEKIKEYISTDDDLLDIKIVSARRYDGSKSPEWYWEGKTISTYMIQVYEAKNDNYKNDKCSILNFEYKEELDV